MAVLYRVVAEHPATHTLCGAGSGLGDVMYARGLPEPPAWLASHRARGGQWWFTERGWRVVGRYVAIEARRRGLAVIVKRSKMPRRSSRRVVWSDEHQVMIRPSAAS